MWLPLKYTPADTQLQIVSKNSGSNSTGKYTIVVKIEIIQLDEIWVALEIEIIQLE